MDAQYNLCRETHVVTVKKSLSSNSMCQGDSPKIITFTIDF